MLARVVPYGGNAVMYALDKEKAKVVKVNHMPEGIDPTAIWHMMKHHCQLHQQDRTVGRALERLMVQFVISPSKELLFIHIFASPWRRKKRLNFCRIW